MDVVITYPKDFPLRGLHLSVFDHRLRSMYAAGHLNAEAIADLKDRGIHIREIETRAAVRREPFDWGGAMILAVVSLALAAFLVLAGKMAPNKRSIPQELVAPIENALPDMAKAGFRSS